MLTSILLMLAILSAGVVYGVDVFFAVVGRLALAESEERAISDVMGHIHQVADVRMPLFGVVAVVSTIILTVVTPLGTPSSWLVFSALAGMLIQLVLYFLVAKPVNEEMKASLLASHASLAGHASNDIRALQNRWDSVVSWRAMAMTLAMGCLVARAIYL